MDMMRDSCHLLIEVKHKQTNGFSKNHPSQWLGVSLRLPFFYLVFPDCSLLLSSITSVFNSFFVFVAPNFSLYFVLLVLAVPEFEMDSKFKFITLYIWSCDSRRWLDFCLVVVACSVTQLVFDVCCALRLYCHCHCSCVSVSVTATATATVLTYLFIP